MTGAASWEQILFIVGVVVAIIAMLIKVFHWILMRQERMHTQNLAAYKASVDEQAKLRNDLVSGNDARFKGVHDRIAVEEHRIDQIELFNAGLRIIMRGIDEFKIEVRERFSEVNRDRKEEIGKIDKKLDQIIKDQLRRRNEIEAGTP